MKGDGGAFAILLAILVLVLWMIAGAAPLELTQPEPAPSAVVLPSPYSGEPMATFDRRDKRLTLERIPNDALVCIRGDCRLEVEWLAK
jgi:hypothetical protein